MTYNLDDLAWIANLLGSTDVDHWSSISLIRILWIPNCNFKRLIRRLRKNIINNLYLKKIIIFIVWQWQLKWSFFLRYRILRWRASCLRRTSAWALASPAHGMPHGASLSLASVSLASGRMSVAWPLRSCHTQAPWGASVRHVVP